MCTVIRTCILYHIIKSPLKIIEPTKIIVRKCNLSFVHHSNLNPSKAEIMEDNDILTPPKGVRGMKDLRRELFSKTIEVPWIIFPVSLYCKCLKKYLLKLENLKPMQELDLQENENVLKITSGINEGEKQLFKKIFLNPLIIKSFEDINVNDRIFLEKHGITKDNFHCGNVTLTYKNWRADEVLKAVLPVDKGNLTSYSKIGHIVHVNLKENLLEYKNVIGQVLLDKVHGARTVVNKVDAIDNTYRNFKMELLCGEDDMKAQVRENRCVFEFDFSAVYWNPRLCTEHERILASLSPGDVLFDVFAGVGPFSIPAARHRQCDLVMANDLNPESYHWLVHNASLNKVPKDKFNAFNKDGWKFIAEDIALTILKRWESNLGTNNSPKGKLHVVMNLPGRATEFLGAFCGMLSDKKHIRDVANKDPLTIYVYCFVAVGNSQEEAINLVEKSIGTKFHPKDIAFVRKVSPSKEMLRVTFELPMEVVFCNIREQLPEPPPKRICLDETVNIESTHCNGETKDETTENEAATETSQNQQDACCVQSSRCSQSES